MKYKIKVDVRQDGNSYYYPMVKKHWWSCWKYICNMYKTVSNIKNAYSFKNLDYAKKEIQFFHKNYIEHTTDHTYEISYKIEE